MTPLHALTGPAAVRRMLVGSIAAATYACGGEAGPAAPTTPPPPPAPPAAVLPDLNAGWIERLPHIPYLFEAGDPPEAGWPAPGEVVTWRAHVRSWVDTALLAVAYEWSIDGAPVASGTIDIPPGTHAAVDLERPWSFAREELGLRLDPADAIAEAEEANNAVEVYTDALSVGFWVEESLYAFMHETQPRIAGLGSRSFEDWAQRQTRWYNAALAASRSADAPDGALDRLRLDRVVVVPDGAIGGLFYPDPGDFSLDFQWGFPSEPRQSPGGAAQLLTSLNVRADPTSHHPFVFFPVVLHEMMHERGLADVYAYDVFHDDDPSATNWIGIRESGVLVAGGPLMPLSPGNRLVYDAPMTGIMDRPDSGFFSVQSTLELNRLAGRRTPWEHDEGSSSGRGSTGFSNYLTLLPARNVLRLQDPTGAPLAGATVQVFQDTAVNTYGEFFDDVPDLTVTADANGRVDLGSNPFGPRLEPRTSAFGFEPKPVTAILRVEHAGRVGYAFLPSYVFNIEYLRGETNLGESALTIAFPDS